MVKQRQDDRPQLIVTASYLDRDATVGDFNGGNRAAFDGVARCSIEIATRWRRLGTID